MPPHALLPRAAHSPHARVVFFGAQELYSFLEEEQCAGGEWLSSWLQFLLARDLPLPCLLRLCDTCATRRLF